MKVNGQKKNESGQFIKDRSLSFVTIYFDSEPTAFVQFYKLIIIFPSYVAKVTTANIAVLNPNIVIRIIWT